MGQGSGRVDRSGAAWYVPRAVNAPRSARVKGGGERRSPKSAPGFPAC
jgi:hypothetical protein